MIEYYKNDWKRMIIMRILLAEDDRELNQTLTISLELEGFTVDSCYDGE